MDYKLIVTVEDAEDIDDLIFEIEASEAAGVDARINVEVES